MEQVVTHYGEFSSPFIEERLYLEDAHLFDDRDSAFSSPFIEERLYFMKPKKGENIMEVLVPFYRGAVVFREL